MTKRKRSEQQLCLSFNAVSDKGAKLTKKLPSLTECKECGMLYSEVGSVDKANHLKYHQMFFDGVPLWKMDLNQDHNDNFRIVKQSNSKRDSMIIILHDVLKYKAKLKHLLDLIQRDLGAIELSDEELRRAKVYLYVQECANDDKAKSSRRIIGCCVVEPIVEAYKFQDDKTQTRTVTKAVCGISRIWTSAGHRRKGIASQLLNVVKITFAFAQVLTMKDVAFSQPTALGQKLAESFDQDFLVYQLD
ncbi:hypothetical protein MP228_011890 [Amoeboaphelidium protococcarum]|nr:hypothetical protein MP228_011890 [Amoeboaphelidium protococcarum]